MKALTFTPCTSSGVGCHWVPMPVRFHFDIDATTSGEANSTLSVEPYWKTSLAKVSKKSGVSGPLASRRTDWMNSDAPPHVPCGSPLPGAAPELAAKERAPQKASASHLRLCSRALRTASLPGSRPPYSSMLVIVPVKVHGVRVIWV